MSLFKYFTSPKFHNDMESIQQDINTANEYGYFDFILFFEKANDGLSLKIDVTT